MASIFDLILLKPPSENPKMIEMSSIIHLFSYVYRKTHGKQGKNKISPQMKGEKKKLIFIPQPPQIPTATIHCRQHTTTLVLLKRGWSTCEIIPTTAKYAFWA